MATEERDLWLSYFISIRDSRREDMRHYTSFSFTCGLSIIAVVVGLLAIPALAVDLLEIRLAIVEGCLGALIALGLMLRNFRNQYRVAEIEIKDYSDAIETVLMNPPLSVEDYQKLYYLLTTRSYRRQTEWGKYCQYTKYLTAGLGDRTTQTRRILSAHRGELSHLAVCFENPSKVAGTIPLRDLSHVHWRGID